MDSMNETYVLLELAGSTYAVPSRNVLHIDMLEHVTLVPNAHAAVEGVVFSRGHVIPALSLRTRFGFPRENSTMRTRIVFVQAQKRTVGLIADAAREFKNIPGEGIRPIEEALTGVGGNYLKAVAKIGDRLILLLDLEKVIDLDDPTLSPENLEQVVKSDSPGAPVSVAA